MAATQRRFTEANRQPGAVCSESHQNARNGNLSSNQDCQRLQSHRTPVFVVIYLAGYSIPVQLLPQLALAANQYQYTRAFVQTGDNVIIGGFIVQGTEPKKLIVRAIGPELTQHGVPDALHDPTLELHDGTGALIASNDNWVTTIIGGIITQNQVRDIMNSGHAPSNGLESAIIADLQPGNYTAIVRGVNDTTGVGLVEVYDLNNPGTDSFFGFTQHQQSQFCSDRRQRHDRWVHCPRERNKEGDRARHWPRAHSVRRSKRID